MLSRASAVSSTPQRMRTAGACWFAIGSGPELLGASLANAAATYAVYHGPIVLERIAKKVHFLSQILKSAVGRLFFLSGAQQNGGLISVKFRIHIAARLQSDILTEFITGIIVLHAERVTALSPEAFIVRLYRDQHKAGFLKAF
ncbi:hypothetical protein P692DRAFT_201861807 [Suillus brevipes Sb2]|nr:hypothetical protein P692DRAFT_201861807 [Suillus brevipes Sb2]